LTGLANRRHFDETFDREWRRCERSGKSLAVIMLDIDHFKLFNDGYGHQAGDDCLQAVAGVLVEAAQRPFDIAARYGGEEFVVILPETDMAAARRIAEKIVSGVMALNIPHAYSSVAESVTISAGVSAALPGNELACADLLRTADEALYKTKHTSRNGLTCKLQPRAA
ncbi:MAG: GGDEF domain-containing protein, partial [Pseudomonadales bacterium]|nr:GGDEF domain-containing protein [Pseudomonadales bacterium]